LNTARNPVRRLTELGQSVWLDFIERSFVRRGALAALIRDDGVSGVTSNPAIFHKAIPQEHSYRASIAALMRAGLAAHEIHEALIIQDIRDAADALADVFARSGGRDGFVSLEVSPHLARDTDGTYWEARRLWTLVDRPNLMIKVPGTNEGVPAVRRLIADGLNVNVTLLFSVERYAAIAAAFVDGLEDRLARGLSLENVASVASFFLSRIDTLIDSQLDASDAGGAKLLRGECAITCARAAYRHYCSMIGGTRWQGLSSRGARAQRLLWASTSAKDPRYSDVKYVEALIGRDTVTTLPPETLSAYRDHGRPALRLQETPDAAHMSLETLAGRLAEAGIDWPAAAAQLESDGIRKFVEPHEATLAALRKQIATLKES
jgi:transaldolase